MQRSWRNGEPVRGPVQLGAGLILLCVVGAALVPASGEERTIPDGAALWERSLQVQRLPDLRAEIVLTTTTASGAKVMLRLHGVGILQDNGVKRSLLTRVTSGGTLQGTGFLSIEHPGAPSDLWVYLPALGWPRRLIAGDLGDSYLGSEFRYGDLIQPEPTAYVVKTRGAETIDDRHYWVIEVTPRDKRTERDTGLSREVRWIAKDNFVERRAEQYDRRGDLLKVMDSLRWLETRTRGKWLALERRIENVQTHTESTAVFENPEIGVDIPRDIFAPGSLSGSQW